MPNVMLKISLCISLLAIIKGLHLENTQELFSRKGNTIMHTIGVMHPGVSLTDPVKCRLFEIKDNQGFSKEFYMDVATVVCGDALCRIDTIRLFWTALGFYNRLELPSGIELEKAEGLPFEPEDYKKLNSILADKDCSLREVYKQEVVGTESSDGVDAVTGATILLNNQDYVKGAVWTCYTLWHWANGEIYPIIRNIAGTHLNNLDLLHYLQKDNIEYRIFAAEQLIDRQTYDPMVVQAMKENAEANDYQLTKLIIDFLERAIPGVYLESILELLKNDQIREKTLLLNSVSNYKAQIPPSFFDDLVSVTASWKDYSNINLLINILEDRRVASPKVLQIVSQFLDDQNFLIARRVYWYLAERNLPLPLEEKRKLFYHKHADRL